MISGIESVVSPAISGISQQMQAIRAKQFQNIGQIAPTGDVERPNGIQPNTGIDAVGEPRKVTFGSLIGDLVREVDDKGKTSTVELKKVMTGEVDNLHQSMVAMQEASVAFTLMVEVRNKLMESYQQIMRMQV